MRFFTTRHNKKEYKLVASFAASVRLSQQVADPLTISREQAMGAMAMAEGRTYSPKWEMTLEALVDILFIGLSEGDMTTKKEDVEAFVFDVGLAEAQLLAYRYIALFVDPQSERLFAPAGGKKPAGKK